MLKLCLHFVLCFAGQPDHQDAKIRWSRVECEQQVISLFFILQTTALMKCLEIFVCIDVDGVGTVLSRAQDVQCSGSMYTAMQVASVLGLSLYGVAALGYCAFMINRPLARLEQRQFFRDPAKQLLYLRLEHCYSFLYRDYKPFDYHILCDDARRATGPGGIVLRREHARAQAAKMWSSSVRKLKMTSHSFRQENPTTAQSERENGGEADVEKSAPCGRRSSPAGACAFGS